MASYPQDLLFIGGEWVAPASTERITVVSPHTESVISEVSAAAAADIDAAVGAAREAFDRGPWPHLDVAQRIEAIGRLMTLYGEQADQLAATITAETGAPISFSRRAQVGLPQFIMSTFAELAAQFPWQEERPGAYSAPVHLRREPVGVVAAVVPWNMPQFLVITKVVPALLAGCSVILKPAPESPLNALALAELVKQADLPRGVFSVVPAEREVSHSLVAHRGVDKVSFTGSTAVGRQIAETCGRNLTRVSLELGGKSVAIVLDDADPQVAAAAVRMSGIGMAGQICNSLTRVLVPRAQLDHHTEALVATMSDVRIGDPADPQTQMGPLISQRQQQRVWDYIDRGCAEGAKLALGGTGRPAGIDRGWYAKPTVFTGVANAMTIAQEEIFGPVTCVIPYGDEVEAIEIANDSEYGLAGSVFTADDDRGLEVARRVRTGTFGINQGYPMDPAAPFGGVKASGYGRELGREGIEGYTETKSISVAGA